MTPEVRSRLGAERAAVGYIIKHELGKRGLTINALARQMGCSGNNISQVIRGLRHSPRVLDALREVGVPEELLFDPRRVQVPTLEQAKK